MNTTLEAIPIRELEEKVIRSWVERGGINTSSNVSAIYTIELIHTAIQESSRYYRLLPTYNDKRGLEPILNTVSVDNENARLNDARYINFTLNVVLAAKHRAKEINPFDYSYRSLGCQLAEIEPDSRTFNVVSKYMTSTAKDSGYEIAHLFSVDRDQEKERFKPYAADPNRKLLWHGSQLGNFMGILNQGLRSKPAAAEESVRIRVGISGID